MFGESLILENIIKLYYNHLVLNTCLSLCGFYNVAYAYLTCKQLNLINLLTDRLLVFTEI